MQTSPDQAMIWRRRGRPEEERGVSTLADISLSVAAQGGVLPAVKE